MNTLNPAKSTVLRVYCRNTKSNYLVDTGSCVSVSPARDKDKEYNSNYFLYAANHTPIRCYGSRELTLDLGMQKTFTFKFVLADLDINIIGSDFLAEHGLCVDIKNKKLFDNNKKHISPTLVHQPHINNIRPVKNLEVWNLIEKYPSLTKEEPYYPGLKINYLAEIKPKPDARPQACRPRRLSPQMNLILEGEVYIVG